MYVLASVRNLKVQLEEIVFFVIHIAVEIIMILSLFYVQPLIIPLFRHWNNGTTPICVCENLGSE
jgi:hypothetical protein